MSATGLDVFDVTHPTSTRSAIRRADQPLTGAATEYDQLLELGDARIVSWAKHRHRTHGFDRTRADTSTTMRTLSDIANTLESADDPTERVCQVLRLLRRIVPYEQCGLLEVWVGAEDRLTLMPHLAEPEGATLRVTLRHLLTRIADDTQLVGTGSPATSEAPMPWNSRLAVPLVGFDQVIGLLFIGHHIEGKYSEKDLRVLSVVAAQLAAYLTALREHTGRIEADELDVVTEAALAHAGLDDLLTEVLGRIQKLLGADAVVLLLRSDDGESVLERASVGLGQHTRELRIAIPPNAAQVAANSQPLGAADLAGLKVIGVPFGDVLKSLLATPLLANGGLLGMVLVGRFEPGQFTEKDARLVRLIGERVAVPLEHAWLFSEEQRNRAHAEAIQRRLALLYEVTTLVTTSLDNEDALQSAARVMVPSFADLCIVDIAGEDDEIRQVAVAHANPVMEDETRQSRARHPVTLNSAHPVADVLRTNRPRVYHEIPDLLSQSIGGHTRRLGIRGPHYLRSAMVVPLLARGRALGAITYVSVDPERYQPADVALAEQVARRVAFAVDNARLYREAQQAEGRYRRLFARRLKSRAQRTGPTGRSVGMQLKLDGVAANAEVTLPQALVEHWLDRMPLSPLTPRERDVLDALVAGASTREIADQLVVSEHSVRYHLGHLFQKLEVHSRTQLVARALQLGLTRWSEAP